MPRVPTYDSFKADPTGMGGQFQNQQGVANPQQFQPAGIQPVGMPTVASVSADLAGAGGRQLQALGEGISRLGGTGLELAARAQNEANSLRIDEALNKAQEEAMKLEFDKSSGFRSQLGFNALERESKQPLAQEYGEKYKQTLDSISEGLGNETQRKAFSLRANDLHTRFVGSAMAHETSQFKEYSVSVARGTVANQMNSIGLNYNNPQLVDEAINGQYGVVDGQRILVRKGIRQAVWDEAQATGQSAEWVNATTRDRISKAHTTAIETAINQGDIGYANSYLNRATGAGQMDADDILRVQKVITHDLDGRQAMGAATNVINSSLRPVSESDRAFRIVQGESANAGGSSFQSPLSSGGRVSSPFGERSDPMSGVKASHHGTDYAAPEGADVVAVGAGKVVRVGNEPTGYGNFVEIQHPDGHTSLYAHASEINVKVGDTVEGGTKIAAVGSTGKSTGSHLHFEMRKDGKPVDGHEMINGNPSAKKEFNDNLNYYRGDIAKTYTAQLVGKSGVEDAVNKAKAQGSPSDWVRYLEPDTGSKVTGYLKAYEADKGVAKTPPSLMDLHEQVRQNLGPGARPQVVRAALDEVTRMHTDYTRDSQEKDSRLEADTMRELIKNKGSWTSLPPQMISAIQDRIPGKWDDLQKFASTAAGGVPVKTDMAVYNKLINNPQGLADISDDQFFAYKSKLSDPDFKSLADQRAKYKTGDGKGTASDIDASAINQSLNERLRMLRIDPTPKDDGGEDAARVGVIRNTVMASIASAQKESGKKFSDIEIAKHIDSLFAKTDVIDKVLGNGSGPVLANNIGDLPSTVKAGLRAGYKRQGISSPTDAQILSQYQYERLFKK